MPQNETPEPTPRQHEAGTYQMLWDCRFCGTQKLLGVTHRHCPNCGAAQDPEWRYFPAEEDMVALENHPYVGADKICPACGQPNSAANTYCSECGWELANANTVEIQGTRELGTGGADSDTRRDVELEKFQAEMQRIGATPDSRPVFLGLRKETLWIIGGLLLVGLVIAGIVYAVTYRKEASGQVSRMTWERAIEIQDFQPHAMAGWDETVPVGAYGVVCSQRQRGVQQVPDGSHEECRDVDMGNGAFDRVCQDVIDYRNETVYGMWCSYTVDLWSTRRSVTSSGEGKNPLPSWPAYTLAAGAGRYGQERVGAQRESYAVVVRDQDGKDHTCEFEKQMEWERFDVGAAVTLELNITGGADCDMLALRP